MNYQIAREATPSFNSYFPVGTEIHWRTERRLLLNPQGGADELHELIYEIAWIPELGVWRHFLKSQRRVEN